MGQRPTVEPTLVEENDRERVFTHPAFGQVTVSRVTGTRNLYDTDFRGQQYVRVSLYRSELHRSLSNDWHYQKKILAEFDLSEAQWATFVSSFGVGKGVPCTLSKLESEWDIPNLPDPDVMAPFALDVRETLNDSVKQLQILREKLVAKKASKDVLGHVDKAIQEIEANLPFVHQQFCERMEETVEKAKAEVHGYINSTITRHGLERIAELNQKLLSRPEPNDGTDQEAD